MIWVVLLLFNDLILAKNEYFSRLVLTEYSNYMQNSLLVSMADLH